MTTLSLTINGERVRAEVEPRLNLADFLREHRFLTATHVGCEHGVCGACTVLVDGKPARSCLAFAVAVDGASVTTLEGFADDSAMNVLREAFAEHHGLQCGFCTPGMLMTARDIVTRLPDADERRIRLELSGNLCRCTGYVGIVKAVESTLATLNGSVRVAPAAGLGPAGAHPPTLPHAPGGVAPRTQPAAVAAAAAAENLDAIDWAAVERDGVELRQSFTVAFPREEVWRLFADLDAVARCMPGARLTSAVRDGRAEGEVNVKLGPIVSAFQGQVAVTQDDGNFRGTVRGAGRDAKSPSAARALISYAVSPQDASGSKVDVSVTFLLSGPLAQFSRSGLVKDVADHLTKVFARNLEARLSGQSVAEAKTLDAGTLARSALWTRLRTFFRRN